MMEVKNRLYWSVGGQSGGQGSGAEGWLQADAAAAGAQPAGDTWRVQVVGEGSMGEEEAASGQGRREVEQILLTATMLEDAEEHGA